MRRKTKMFQRLIAGLLVLSLTIPYSELAQAAAASSTGYALPDNDYFRFDLYRFDQEICVVVQMEEMVRTADCVNLEGQSPQPFERPAPLPTGNLILATELTEREILNGQAEDKLVSQFLQVLEPSSEAYGASRRGSHLSPLTGTGSSLQPTRPYFFGFIAAIVAVVVVVVIKVAVKVAGNAAAKAAAKGAAEVVAAKALAQAARKPVIVKVLVPVEITPPLKIIKFTNAETGRTSFWDEGFLREYRIKDIEQ